MTRTLAHALKLAPSLLELTGAAAIVYGVSLLYVPAAFVVAGVMALAPSVIRNLPKRAAE